MRDGLQQDNEASLPSVYQPAAETPATPPLTGRERFEIVVIGAGLTGLSAALHAANLGATVAVVEANDIGTGASGRSFGQVVPYLKHEPAHAFKLFGNDLGGRLVATAAGGPAFVFGLIEKHQIACEAVSTGLIFAAHSREGLEKLEHRAAFWRERGVAVNMLDRDGTARAIGGGDYPGALLDHRGGSLNSLAFARGLARVAINSGATIFSQSPVHAIRPGRSTSWQVAAGSGTIAADKVLICTNAYRNQLVPGVTNCVLPIRVHQAASEPLTVEAAHDILPGGQALTDTRRLPSGVRLTRDRRLVVTVEGPIFASAGAKVQGAEQRIAHLFPRLGAVNWSTSWSGWIDMAPDQYPRIFESAPGILAGLGLSGRGLALGPLLGRDLARRAVGTHADDLSFDVAGPHAGPRWHPGAKVVVGGVALQRRWLDRLDAWRTARQTT